MNYQELIEELQKQEISVSNLAYGDIEDPLPNIGAWEEIDQYGGEGQGETWYSIKYFPDHRVYIKISGFYSSYNGTDFDNGWDDVKEVKPQEKTVTVYEAI